MLLAALTLAVHLAAARVIRAPPAIGLLASAQLGVPAAVIALGLPIHAIDQGQASAIFCSALISIGACAAGAAHLRRDSLEAGGRRHRGKHAPAAEQPTPAR